MKTNNLLTFDKIKEIVKKDRHSILQESSYRYYSVMIPIIEIDAKLHILFEKRSENLINQPNEICFPGGCIEKGETPMEAAIRETTEELCIEKSEIEIYSEMPLLVAPFGTILHSFVGKISSFPKNHSKDEVSEIFTIPLKFFMDTPPEKHEINVKITPDDLFPYHYIEKGASYKWGKGKYTVNFYFYGEKIVWGMTAKLLLELVNELKKG